MNKKCFLVVFLLISGILSQSLANPILGEYSAVLEPGKYELKKNLLWLVSDEVWNNEGERQDYEAGEEVKEGFEAREFEIQLELYRGIVENLELGLVFPFLFLNKTPYLGAQEKSGQGRGDLELKAKYNLISGKIDLPSISGLLIIKLPTGKEAKKGSTDLPTSSGGTDLTFMGILTKNLEPFTTHLNLAYTLTGKGKNEEGIEINPGNVFTYDVTLDYPAGKRTTIVTELIGEFKSEDRNSQKKKINASKSSLMTLLLGLQYETVELHNTTLQAAIAYRVTGKNKKTGITPILGFIREF
ncbi:MAG: transporter [bacterium]